MKIYKVLILLTSVICLWTVISKSSKNREVSFSDKKGSGSVKKNESEKYLINKVRHKNDKHKKGWSQKYQEIYDSLDVNIYIYEPYEMIPVHVSVTPSTKMLSLEARLKEEGFYFRHESKRKANYFTKQNIKLSKLLDVLKIIKRDNFSRVESYAVEHPNHWLNTETGSHEWFVRAGSMQCHVSIATYDKYLPSSVFYPAVSWKDIILPPYLKDVWVEEVKIWTRSSIKDMDYFPEAVTPPSTDHLKKYEKEIKSLELSLEVRENEKRLKKYLETERYKKLENMSSFECLKFKEKEKQKSIKKVRRSYIESALINCFVSPKEHKDHYEGNFLKFINDKIDERYKEFSEEKKTQAVEKTLQDYWLAKNKEIEYNFWCIRNKGKSNEEWQQEWQTLREKEIKSFEKYIPEIREYLDGDWNKQMEAKKAKEMKEMELRKKFNLN